LQGVILCGGRGTRMGASRKSTPKVLAKIGDRPILWHIMKFYAAYGVTDFVLCLGFGGEAIRHYFEKCREWKVIFVETGLETNTGGRIKRAQSHIQHETFFATYGDGVSDVNLDQLLQSHHKGGTMATLTAVKPESQYGILDIGTADQVSRFIEKPRMDEWVNGGFFVFSRSLFDHLGENDVLEREVFHHLVDIGELKAFRHEGFWKCMDTQKDRQELERLWKSGQAPWAVWHKKLDRIKWQNIGMDAAY
jgi:glucose-1-phosphate cytidylyltransferase